MSQQTHHHIFWLQAHILTLIDEKYTIFEIFSPQFCNFVAQISPFLSNKAMIFLPKRAVMIGFMSEQTYHHICVVTGPYIGTY